MSITGLMNQTISLYNKASLDRYGREQIIAAVFLRARVQRVSKTRYRPDGTLYVIIAIIYIPAGTTINEGDKIIHNSINYRVHGISIAVDGGGNTNHIKVECTKWITS